MECQNVLQAQYPPSQALSDEESVTMGMRQHQEVSKVCHDKEVLAD